MKTKADIEAAITAWLLTVLPTGVPAIFENQNAPRPVDVGKQYLSLFGPHIVRETEVDQLIDQDQPEPDVVTIDSAFQYAVYVLFAVHADSSAISAVDLAWNLHRAVQKQIARDALQPLAVVDVDQVQEVPEQLEDQFEARAEFTVQFRLGVMDQDTVEAIEHVEITGTVTGGQNPLTVSVTLDAPG